ncbi:hypothetical protein AVEN_35534-1 [Araneus ventricosus]|uniref:Uncharacterized protein n=1 Tax=Araneus ventricosus TaxID=182803 RepID=A0A4Y2HLL4_ARAVE|nr:hypothetical protein AVEN_35534-1 [Araneus ventricosus]
MSVGDRVRCLSTCHLSELSLDVSGVPYHANCTRPIPSQRLHQIEQSPVGKQGLWINDVVSINDVASVRYNWKRDSSHQATCFQSSTIQW